MEIKHMKILSASLLLIIVGLGFATGCVTQRCSDASRRGVTQVSTYTALYRGLYQGVMSLGEIKRHGNLGLGTLDGWDGEVLLLDGKFYLVSGDGSVKPITDMSATAPFMEVAFFNEDSRKGLPAGTTYLQMQQRPADFLAASNTLYALKIEGTFRHVKTRSMPKQSPPYRLMADLVKSQPTFEFADVRGTMVGFWSPPWMKGVALPGWHLHFITADKKAGGHVLEFVTGNAVMKMEKTREFHWLIPDTEGFRTADFTAY